MDEKTHKFYKNSTLSHSNVLAVVIKFQLMFLVMFAVLGRIRQLEKKLMITNSRLPSVQEVLSRFSGRLSEAQGFLAKADSNVHEAENKNRASVLKFQRHEVISRDPPQLLQHPTSLSHLHYVWFSVSFYFYRMAYFFLFSTQNTSNSVELWFFTLVPGI